MLIPHSNVIWCSPYTDEDYGNLFLPVKEYSRWKIEKFGLKFNCPIDLKIGDIITIEGEINKELLINGKRYFEFFPEQITSCQKS
jgi:hypothetical protein